MGADSSHNKKLEYLSPANRKSLLSLLNRSFSLGSSRSQVNLSMMLMAIDRRSRKNNFLPKHQAAFRSNFSTIDHIIRLESTARLAMNEGKITAAVFFDLTKAYNVTWINGILYKMEEIKFNSCLLKWLKNFLTGRTAQVLVNGAFSRQYVLSTGVPKSSVLNPILFNILMADLPTPIADEGIELTTFADDIAFYTTSDSSTEARGRLQRYIYGVEKWAHMWKLRFLVDKCAAMIITRRRRYVGNLRLTLKASPISEVERFKFLDVTFNSRLTWTD